jgi:hypothetical protein
MLFFDRLPFEVLSLALVSELCHASRMRKRSNDAVRKAAADTRKRSAELRKESRRAIEKAQDAAQMRDAFRMIRKSGGGESKKS